MSCDADLLLVQDVERSVYKTAYGNKPGEAIVDAALEHKVRTQVKHKVKHKVRSEFEHKLVQKRTGRTQCAF